MGIIAWVIFGALAGWIASKIMNTDAEQGAVANIVVGIIGAMLGGFIMQTFGQSGITGFNVYSIIVAILGACAALGIYRAVRGRKHYSV
jgi:uncharacterized membrane protein YeaQ/YmgE (transglycosylase-associated protein family)